MVDWLVLWGITQGLGVIVTPILQELAKEGAKDFAKDFFKDSLNKVLFSEKDPRQIAAGKAIKEFLQLVQQQLKIKCKLSELEIKQYTQDIKRFINHKTVKSILGKAFNLDCESLDAQTLKNTWNTLQLKPLPEKFNWEHITEQYLLKVQEILFDSEDLRNILDSQNLKNIEKYTQQLAGIIPGFDLIGYQETIRERFGNLKLESLDTTGCAYNELKLWRIFIAQNVREVHQVAPQVYELPKEHIRQLRDSDQIEAEINFHDLERYKQSYSEQPIKSVLDIINEKHNHKYLVILGDPGSGKSTLLQFLALNWAESPLDNIVSQPIPLLIELRSYMRNREEGHCKNFLEFFHQCSGAIHHLNQNQLHEQLKAGKVLVMFDGLDEIFDLGQRENIITDIHRFTNEYPQVQVIVTSRVIGYKPQRLRDAEFRHFMLQELDKNQVQEFIDRWHNLTFNDQADKIRKQARLERAITTSKAIKELAGNPLLLTMMVILNRHQELPRDRPELYHQASRVLLHQWDVERALIEDPRIDPKTIDYRDKQAMLRQIAHYMQANEKGLSGNIIKVNDLEKILTNYLRSIEIDKPREAARVMINQLRTRNFILCLLGADYYAFVHRTFLEYFCAWSFVWQFKEDQTLTIEQLKTDVFGQHWRDETWHEVLRLIAGMIEPKFTGEIIEYLMQLDGEADKFVNVFLAADLLTEVKNTQLINSTVDKLHQTLKDLTEYDIDYYYEYGKEANLVEEIRTKSVQKIINTWHDDPNTLCWLKQCAINGNNGYLRGAVVEEIAQKFKKDAEVLHILKQSVVSDEKWYVRRTALYGLAQNFKENPDILLILKQSITSDNDWRVRDAAVRSLGENFKDHPETLSTLKQYVNSDDKNVRNAAVHSLADNFKGHPETLSMLKEYINSDDEDVRIAAIHSLAENFKEDPDTLLLIKVSAKSDIGIIRRVAVFALELNFSDDPNTLSTLKKYATSDDYDLQKAALLALARSFKDDPDTLSILKKGITSPDTKLRETAASVLLYEFKNDPNILDFLKQHALSDSNMWVRYFGVISLEYYEKYNSEILALLKQLALSDNSEIVRYQALTGLAKYYKTDSTLFDLFYNCANNDPCELKGDFHSNPRLIALKIISKQYPEHPQTIPLLRDRMENDADEQVREFAKMKLTELET